MNSRLVYIVKLTCQGQRMEIKEFYNPIKAFLQFLKHARKCAKYGTMRADITAWRS